MLALRRLSPLLLLAAALLALAVLFAPGAQPAQAQTTTVWSATLMVSNVSGQFGCHNSATGAECSSTSVLTNDGFRYDGGDYEFTGFVVGGSRFTVTFSSIPGALRSSGILNVGGTQLRFSDAVHNASGTQAQWENAGLSWSVGDTISLSLTGPAPPLPPGTAWTATLTAKNVPSPDGTASAAFGCQAHASGADCTSTSVLTDDDFTYDGVDYAVTELWEASNTIVFGLDRAIPQRLRAATLTAAGTALSFADATYTDGGATVTWSNTGLDWSADTQVSLSLTAPIPPARSAPDEETTHWSDTLTVQELDWGRGVKGLGCGYWRAHWGCSTGLSGSGTITYHGATYEVEMVQVAYSGGTLQFVLDKEPKDEDGSTTEQSRLVLRVGSGADAREFRVADAIVGQGIAEDTDGDGVNDWTNRHAWVLTWTGTSLAWNENDVVSLSLVTPPVGGL